MISLRKSLGVVAVLAGLALLLWVGLELVDRKATQRAGREQLERAPVADELPPFEGTPKTPAPQPPAGALVARILIPAASVDAVALQGVDDATLKRAAGHFPGTAMPGQRGNASFAAHRNALFRGLRDVEIGQKVEVETADAVHLYEIEETRVVEPTRIDVIEPRGGRHLTLITCFPFDYVGPAPQRFVVHARWIDARGRDVRPGP